MMKAQIICIAFALNSLYWLPADAADTAGVSYAKGLEFIKMAYPNRARAAFEEAIKADPGGPIAAAAQHQIDTYLPKLRPVPEDALNMYFEGWRLYRAQKTAEAIQTWQDCIRKYPQFDWPYLQVAYKLYAKAKYAEAEHFAREAVNIRPTYVDAWIELGFIKWKQNDIKAARSNFAKALSVDPGNEEAKQQIRICR